MSSDTEVPSKKQITARTNPFVVSAFAGVIVASIVIPGAILLRRRRNVQFSTVAMPRQAVKRDGSHSFLPRTSSNLTTPPKRESNTVQKFPRPAPIPAASLPGVGASDQGKETEDELPPEQPLDFNPALLTLKAFGIATVSVMIGAVGLVWSVKNTMGVENTEQFARRMREIILTRMPILSSRIHRSHTEAEGRTVEFDPTWNWDDAENRLTTAFQKDGISGWMELAVKEIEAEEAAEREKRAALKDRRT